MPILICLLYLLLHAGLYFVNSAGSAGTWVRKGDLLVPCGFRCHRDRSFRYLGAFDGEAEAWTWFVAVVMLHGIYSLSFLELWALADDSYSVAIMEIVGQSGTAGGAALIRGLEAIGMSKQTSRLDALQAIGLIRLGRDRDSRSPPRVASPSGWDVRCFSSPMFASMADPCG